MKKGTLILFISILFCINLVCAESTDYFALKWEHSLNGGVAFIEISDLEDDGKNEIVAAASKQMLGGAAGWVNVLDANKEDLGQYFLPGHVTGMVVDDLEGDGEKEIITSVFSRIHVLDSKAQKRWEMAPRHEYDISSLNVGDVDGDGKKEILIGAGSSSLRNELFVVSSEGKIIWSVNAVGEVRSIESEDIDGDGVKEILIGSYGRWGTYSTPAALQVFSNKGDKIFTYATPRGVASIHVEDVDEDGKKEILVGSYQDLYVIDKEGADLWKYSTGGLIRGIAVEDIDKDSEKEIILGSNDVYALSSDGDLEWANAVGPEAYDLELVDLNKDGSKEIIVACSDAGYVIEGDGETLWEYEANTVRAVSAGDLEGDGYIELALGAGDKKVYLFQSETYAKEQEAYNNYKLAESSYNKRDYVSAMKYAKKAKELYSVVGDTQGVANAQTLISKIESDSMRTEQEESLADEYYNKSVGFYLSGDYVNASAYAQKAKYKYAYLKNNNAVEKCNDIINNSAQFMVLEADVFLENATHLYDTRKYEEALTYALKSRANYDYLKDSNKTRESEEILAGIYYKLAESRTASGDFENASVFVQKSFYLYSCLDAESSAGCNPANIELKDIKVLADEILEEKYENSEYMEELLRAKTLMARISREDTGNPLDRLSQSVGSNIIYIIIILLVLVILGLLVGSLYLIGKRQKSPERAGGLTSLGSAEDQKREKPKKEAPKIKKTTPPIRKLPKIKKDRLLGYGLPIKKTMKEESGEDEL